MEGPFKRVTEATYLATDKSDKYRAILRYFYIQHERLREFLMPEEVYIHLKVSPYFEKYEMEELHSDLASLVKWRNLRAQQESGKVKTIDEFKKKDSDIRLLLTRSNLNGCLFNSNINRNNLADL